MTTKKTLLAVLALCTFVLLAVPAAADEAPVDPAVKERVRHLLNGYERIPRPKELLAVPELDRVLESLYQDAALPAHVRARALSSFSVLPPDNARATTLLTAVALDEKTHLLFRRTAVRSYITLKGAASLPVIEPILAHKELTLRQGAIESLIPLAGKEPAVQAALKARLPLEPSPVVQEQLQRALTPPKVAVDVAAPAVAQ